MNFILVLLFIGMVGAVTLAGLHYLRSGSAHALDTMNLILWLEMRLGKWETNER
jgi:hypothetical protein